MFKWSVKSPGVVGITQPSRLAAEKPFLPTNNPGVEVLPRFIKKTYGKAVCFGVSLLVVGKD